ncbi:PspA/IM30 family protein [Terriglobus albidus]|uniref:PspA/IM30 family protein n=1 Tax=Terriglobus albidus TaxID=1592106 RepID=UPI0021E03DFD|nr:PspA/IM30 family protein [Terriglobus albidus]
MPLLERVTTLLRANLNDLIDKAEDPEKMIKQLLLDMENQLLQVKTQVAIAVADLHLLENRKREYEESAAGWRRKAELAIGRHDEDLARAALDRSLSAQQLAVSFNQQIEDQQVELDTMRNAYLQLQARLKETEAQCELLMARNRRARAASKATAAQTKIADGAALRSLDRMKAKILGQEAENTGAQTVLGMNTVEDRFHKLERESQIDALLLELKEQQRLPG